VSDLFEPIAVVGIAGRLPGARDVRAYWRNLADGLESLTALTDEQLLAAGVSRARIDDAAYVKMAGLMPDVDTFDAEFFGMTPREAELCDPQLRLFLEMTYQAIEDAGYDPTRMGRDVAVYGACGPSRYADVHVRNNPMYSTASGLGVMVLNNVDYLTTLASYKLNLRGPSMAVQTACSSALTAIHLACRSLQFGECDAAVAGASNVDIPHRVGYRWSPGDVRSADGRCRPFDASGTGTIFTSGAGAVLLKRLGDAIVDADHIWGVIHGIGINNDGSDKVSFSAPSVGGQSAAIVDAMAMAGFAPEDIGYVEMHATGTPLGDPIEMSALAKAYRRLAGGPMPTGRIPVGSVKGNIGHTNPVAGLAGLLKVLLALEHSQIPPTINVASANPRLELASTPFFLNDTLRPWPRAATGPRRAGLTSLGIGGTNVHLVLQEGPAAVRTPHLGRPRVVLWSGRDEAAAAANRTAVAGHLTDTGEAGFADAVTTLQRGRAEHRVRGVAVCASAAEAARRLTGQEPVLTGGRVDGDPPEIVFAFPGQGSQHARMAAGLYGNQRVFTDTVDLCLDGLLRCGTDLYPLWLAEDPGDDVNETADAQRLLFAIEYALAQQWIEWGIRPAALLGHSVGELVAATLAGVLELPDALRLVTLRGQAMQRRPRGRMLVVAAGPDRLRPLLPDGGGVVIAAVNAADQSVLAGPPDEVAAVAATLTAAGVASRALRTTHAFHSPAMLPAVQEFQAGFAGVRLRPPQLPVYSAATGKLLTADEAVDPAFWARQLAGPVLFADALDALDTLDTLDAVSAAGHGAVRRIVVEVGPGTALTGLVRRYPAVAAARWQALASLSGPDRRSHGSRPDERDLLGALARLWVAGCAVDWSSVYRDERPQRVSMPGYQFQRRRFWIDPVTGPAAPQPSTTVHPAAGATVEQDAGPFTVPGWVEAARPGPPAKDDPAVALALIPADRAVALPIVSALQQLGHQVCRVRPGGEFAERAGEFTVRPACLAEDLDRVMSRLGAAGTLPSLLVHAWGAGSPDVPDVPDAPAAPAPADPQELAEFDQTFFALLDLVQRAGRRPVAGRLPALLVLTSGAVDVSGGEVVVPARAALIAAVRSFRSESPETDCRVIDLGGVSAEDQLIAELRGAAADPVVALRGSRRWLPTQRSWRVPPGDRPAIRRGGVYVLTGGLGGLGLAVAKGLAATGRRPSLALLSRTAQDAARDAAEDLAEIASMGATVRVIACDVADRPQLARALDEVAATFGPVNGVLHLAGVAGDGMVQFRSRAAAQRVLRPKVSGVLALASALAGRPPVDFVVCFSSQAALTGMIGGADYAAANAFLDAYAAGRPGWLSIDWPGWATVGMARGGVLDALADAVRAARSPGAASPVVAAPDERPGDETMPYYETVLSAATHWQLDEHRIGGAAMLPGTAMIDLVLRAYRDTVAPAAGPVTLRDVVFVRPVLGDAPRRTRVSFEPAGEGAWRVRLLSRADGAGDHGPSAWQEHAAAVLTAGAAPARTVPVAELTAGLSEVPPPSTSPSAASAFLFGPRWHNIERMWESADVTVTRLALAPTFAADAREHAAHPALLDNGSGVFCRNRGGTLMVPFTYRSFTWYAPVPHQVYARARARPGDDPVADVEFVAADGSVVVVIEGLRMRPAALRDLGVGPAAPPTSRPATLPTSGTAGSGGEAGLSPDEGVRLLLRLLAADTPAQVAVVPHRDGRPQQPAELTRLASGRVRPMSAAEPVRTIHNGQHDQSVTGSVQDRLADIWRHVLGRTRIGPEDDFFELGGDSLLGVAMTGRVRDVFGVHLSIGSLFDYPSLASLATALQELGAR